MQKNTIPSKSPQNYTPDKNPINQKRDYKEQKEKSLFVVRKSYLDKTFSFDLKIHYGMMIFFGTVIITIVTQAESLVKSLGIIIYLLLLIIIIMISGITIGTLEEINHKYINKQHRDLIRDIKDNSIDKIEKYSFWRYFNNKKQ